MEFRIYPLTDESRLQEICDLFAQGLGETTVDYWKWKYFSDIAPLRGTIMIAENPTGEIIGMMGLSPRQYICDGKPYVVVVSGDLVINPHHRGKGLFRQLNHSATHFLQDKGYSFMIGFPNSISYPIRLKYGGQDIDHITVIESKNRLIPKFHRISPKLPPNWKIEIRNDIPDDYISFNQASSNCFELEKNYAFMRWRFDLQPGINFKWMVIRKNNEFCGYIVYYVNQGNIRNAVIVCDWGYQNYVPACVIKSAVSRLMRFGNKVSIWGTLDSSELSFCAQLGLTPIHETSCRFVGWSLNEHPLHQHWKLTRADEDF